MNPVNTAETFICINFFLYFVPSSFFVMLCNLLAMKPQVDLPR